MATTVKGVDKFNSKLKKTLFKITSKKQMEKLGNITIGLIHDRTRNKGQGVKTPNGYVKKLKKVSPSYAKWRANQKNKHSDSAVGNDSNLTFTGEMLDSLQVVKATKSKLKIAPTGKDENGVSNQGKSDYQHSEGRSYLYLGKKEVKQLFDKFEDELGKITSKI